MKKYCEYCSSEFKAERDTAKYCSHSCRTMAYRERQQLYEEQCIADSRQREYEAECLQLLELKKLQHEAFIQRNEQYEAETKARREEEKKKEKEWRQEHSFTNRFHRKTILSSKPNILGTLVDLIIKYNSEHKV